MRRCAASACPTRDEEIANADGRPGGPGRSGRCRRRTTSLKRYPEGAASRDFDGDPARITEMDALVAYLQMLGTLVDFKTYDDKANLR